MADTLFMIHGMMAGAWSWDNYRPFFEKAGYRCVTPVLRHHDVDPRDEPDPRLGTVSVLDYADDLEREIRALPEKPILMGHSMGGLLAQMLAARGLARAAVLLTPGVPRGILALTWSVVKSFSEPLTSWAFWRKPFRLSFDACVYAFFHRLPPDEQREFYAKMVHESGQAAFEIGLALLDTSRATEVDERKVTVPVLVVAGSEDRATPAPVVRKVAEKYSPAATFKQFNGFAHMVVAEPGWEEVAGYVLEWLKQKDLSD